MTDKRKILKITEPGAPEKLTTPANKVTDLSQREWFVDIALRLKETLKDEIDNRLKPGCVRMRAAGITAPEIGEDVNIAVIYYVPEGQTEPVWCAFVNPSVKPVEGAELVVDRNFSISTDGIRTEIMRPDTIELRADLAFEIPTHITIEDDIKHACLENMRPNYQEMWHERDLTEEERAREGLKKPDNIGSAFMAQLVAGDKLKGILPLHHVAEEQVEAFLRDPEGFSWKGPGKQQIFAAGPYCEAKGYPKPPDGDLPSPEGLAVLHEFYYRGRQLLLAQTPQNAVRATPQNVPAPAA